jgi:hypothetical protein
LEYVSKSKSYSLDNIADLINRQLMNENMKQKFGTELKFNADQKD